MDLLDLAGVGVKTCKAFEKLGIYNIYDLISFYPKRYDVLVRSDMNNLMDKDKVVLDGIVESKPTIVQLSSGLKKIVFRISDNNGIYNIAVYNQVYLLKELYCGMSVIIIGKYDKLRNIIVANEVRVGKLPDIAKIEPIYGATDGLNRKTIGKIISVALNSDIKICNYIPDYLVKKYKFPDKLWAMKQLHNPVNKIDYMRAKQFLKYEEFFWYLFRIRYFKCSNIDQNDLCLVKKFDDVVVNEFIDELGFELTSDQIKTLDEIKCDLLSGKQMNRLVQGDVGSGKTIVAFITCYMNFLAGYQTAMMVPTEILALQHYQNAVKLFNDVGMNIGLLTSSLTKKKRNDMLKKLSNGELDFIIGTQSLIQNDVIYKNLGLIIIDEQHRFGVNQRQLLKEKCIVPDILSMSATPIPRTYALTIYGDMDVSSIKTKPAGRKEVSTLYKNEKDIMSVLKLMKSELDKGHQIYVVAPAIDDNGDEELNNVIKLSEKMNLAFGRVCNIACIHGNLSNEEKASIMKDFECGKIKILISTTVIEVGVNVPNASMIVVFQANLFGLSTLHQLRGRVGRGNIQSYCILLSKDPCDRLNIMEKTNDGFEISEYDFKNRGEGDLFGIRQSGQAEFKLADLKSDFELLVRVKHDIDDFFVNHFNKDDYKYLEQYCKNDILN